MLLRRKLIHFNQAFASAKRSLTKELYFNSSIIRKKDILRTYDTYKELCQTLQAKHIVDPKGVFCNNEIDLKDIQVYGFDYDYTLAYYNTSLYRLIFNLARDSLIELHKYPSAIRNLEYLPHFPIRGLHLDIRKGWLMKVDSYHNIQLGTVYHGMNAVHDEDVVKHYGGRRLNEQEIGHTQTSGSFHQFVDLFCLPEIALFAQVFQYFLDNGVQFTPEYIFQDVRDAINSIHRNQALHKNIAQSIDDYLLPIVDSTSSSSIHVKEFLNRLKRNGKNIFLITNSPYW
jgi:HAD superfamily 5'-nucleotidase-like hydrolase